ncbi:MAG: S8 family serine peptidase, partial [Deltaproteobacteria bacterium]|nr:S8 family serine peptidase [Deltaproteobacteria bacterium]
MRKLTLQIHCNGALQIVILFFFSMLVFVPAKTYSQDELTMERLRQIKEEIIQEEPRGKDTKINSVVRSVMDKMESMGVTSKNIGGYKLSSLSNPLVRVDDQGNIQTYIYVEDVSDKSIAELEANGVIIEIVNENWGIIQAWIPFDRLVEGVANLSFVIRITNPDYGETRTGSVNTEGDMILNADLLRDTFGIDGTGLKVGVISDGVDSRASSQATGDLPTSITIGSPGSGDEGTAILEIIHDLAPGTELAFSEGLSSSIAFIDSIDFLVNTALIDIIVDDIGFFLEPYFEDGMVAQEAQDAVTSGVIFVSAAGNDAERHYEDDYVDDVPGEDPGNINLHDFGIAAGGSSDTTMSILVGGTPFAPRNFILAVLQWNDPAFGDVLDGIGGSSNDYDLILLNEALTDFACSPLGPPDCFPLSLSPQDGDDDPIELVFFRNNSPNNVRVNLLINRFSGQARLLEIHFNGVILLEEFNIPDGSVFGHPAANGVIAVGAVPAGNPNIIESFSSRGPSLILSSSFESRLKPDVVATDGVSVTGAGGFPSPFFGTSAAAPHAAGVAALLLDAASRVGVTSSTVASAFTLQARLTPNEIEDILETSAVDLGSPGADNTFGFGRIDAFAAVQQVLPEITVIPTSLDFGTVTKGRSANLTITLQNEG